MSRSDRIDVVCDRFEAACRSGERPALEDYLRQVDPAERSDLLRQLLPLEIEYRRARGESPPLQEFLERFAAFQPTVERALAELTLPLASDNRNAERDAARPPDLPSKGALAVGRRFGEYEIVASIGRGGMGVVYRAVQTRLKRPVALKLLAFERRHDPESVTRFAREMEAVGQLDSPHIVRAYDAGEVDGLYYLAMEFVDGCDVATLAKRNPRLPIGLVCEIGRQACLGLQHVHEHGLVHRDIKPSNLLLSAAGVVKVADLGLARFSSSDGAGCESLTSTGQVVGTVDYLAPEQAIAGEAVDIRSDLYSLGCTLYRLLGGRVPFGGSQYDSVAKKLLAHAATPPTSLAVLRPEVPPLLVALIERLMAKHPADRFDEPRQVADMLAQFCDAKGTTGLLDTASLQIDGRRAGEDTWPEPTARDTADISARDVPPPAIRPAPKGTRRFLAAIRANPRTSVAAGIVAVVVLAGGAALWNPFAGPSAPGERDESSTGASVPWWTLLSRTPEDLAYPGRRGAGGIQLDESHRWAAVHSDDLRLVKLGESLPANCIVRVVFDRSAWLGMVGVFLGFREAATPDGRNASMEVVHLYPPQVTTRTLKIERRVWEVGEKLKPRGIMSRYSEDVRYPRASDGEFAELEIEIKGGRVLAVRWMGETVEKLAVAGNQGAFAQPVDDGAWGLVNNLGVTYFREVIVSKQ